VIGNRVPIPLLGEEELAVGGEGLVDGIAGDEGVEVGLGAIFLRAEDAAEALGFFLARAVSAAHLFCPSAVYRSRIRPRC
jgi:hypothetical protein